MRTIHRLVGLAVGLWLTVGVFPAGMPVPASGPAMHQHDEVTLCTLEAIPKDMFTKVEAPQNFRMGVLPGGPGESAATITVNYTGFTAEAQAAFQYAVNIWQAQLTSNGPIVVNATFTSEGFGPTTLGSAGAAWSFRDFTGATRPNTWYAKALANKLFGADVNNAYTPEINARFNSAFTWYLGTDGNTPAGQYDFVSVVLHELCHGLGFFGAGNVSSGLGYVRSGGYPYIWDHFVENGNGQALLTSFTEGTAALAAQLTGDSLYWNGTSGIGANSGQKPRLYAPTTWSQGSSYSHLNEATFPPGNPNSLMTYAIGSAEAIHDPGPVTRGMFSDMGWTTQASTCTYIVSPTTASAAAGGGTGSVTVTTQTGCAWTAASNASFVTITSGASGTGSGTVGYTVAANTGRTRSGTMTIAGQTVTINQASTLPTLTPSRTTLVFGAINQGGVLSSQTPAQRVTVTQSGGTGVAWAARSNVSWLTIATADAAGTGTGAFTVTLNNTANSLPASGSATGTITITAPNAASDPTIPVTVNTYQPSASAMPFGQIDSPAQNATGVQGAIGVTGWAVDDIGVSNVKIYRNCVAFDNPLSCQMQFGYNVVYIGDGAFVPGARPDVEAEWSTYPQAYRAGWGYLMLTNMLPHVPNSQVYGGQGALTLYAIAQDAEGNAVMLGRTRLDSTPTSITMANDTIAKPFGAIDTPGQGQTIGGAGFANFGWVLVRDSNTTGGEAGDILIPTNGSTATVFIDSQPKAQVAYNQCRGTVGNPVPAGTYCNDDVSNIFGNTTPQAVHTIRTSNPTRYRNLDAGRGAIGAYVINTTQYANGLHSIAWGVTDSGGTTEGIGSRNFDVFNAAGDVSHRKASPELLALRDALREIPSFSRGSAATLDGLGLAATKVLGRVGFDLDAPFAQVFPDQDGVYPVRLPALGRIELDLGPVDGGYLVGHGTLRDLPPGSHLDPATGRFGWMPFAGYFGTYRLTFVRGATQIPVDITVEPVTPAAEGVSEIRMHLDAPAPGTWLDGPLTLVGWALDPQAGIGSGIRYIHVWAQRVDMPGIAPQFLGAATLEQTRPDLSRAYGAQFGHAGFSLTAPTLAPGEYAITAFAWNVRTNRWEDARTTRVTVR